MHALLLLLPCFAAFATLAEDWPQYNGAGHARTSNEQLALVRWPAAGPPISWKAETPGGFSSFAIADGKAFTLVGGSREICIALDVETGEELWSAKLSGVKYDGGGGSGAQDNKGGDGPRSTPSYSDGRVYAFDANLRVHCLDAKDGDKIWTRDLVKQHGGKNIRWQNAASPLVEGNLVFVAGGGKRQSLLALDKKSGKVRWKVGDERITHATPIAATIHGVPQIIYYVQAGLVAVNPRSGDVLWRAEYPFRTSAAAS